MHRHQHRTQAAYASAGYYNWNINPDDRWKDQLIIAVGIVVCSSENMKLCVSNVYSGYV